MILYITNNLLVKAGIQSPAQYVVQGLGCVIKKHPTMVVLMKPPGTGLMPGQFVLYIMI
jgi:hypothetical protein